MAVVREARMGVLVGRDAAAAAVVVVVVAAVGEMIMYLKKVDVIFAGELSKLSNKLVHLKDKLMEHGFENNYRNFIVCK